MFPQLQKRKKKKVGLLDVVKLKDRRRKNVESD